MLHIQYRALKIAEDNDRVVASPPKNPREGVKATKNAAYSFIDTMICMEHVVGLIDDIFATEELRQPMERDIYTVLNASKKAAEKWKPVRNRVGGHLSIEAFEAFCDQHNYKGVFISDDLEADLCALNLLAIGAAINDARTTCDIFRRDIQIMDDIALVSQTLTEDCKTAIRYFDPVSRYLYRIGKDEKLAAAHPHDLKGIVRDTA